MTEKEREIFYRLLVDLFVDNPQRRRPEAKKGRDTDENISARERNRTTELNHYQATPNN